MSLEVTGITSTVISILEERCRTLHDRRGEQLAQWQLLGCVTSR